MLWLCLQLHQLPLDVLTRGNRGHEPQAISVSRGNQQHILNCNHWAQQLGVKPGMKLGAAYALVESLSVSARDEAAEQQALHRLAAWAGQFTSLVSIVAPQALVLEIGGSLSFFGGLDRLLAQIREQLTALGYQFVLAVAPTPLAATLLARAYPEQILTDQQNFVSKIMQCPVSVLALQPNQMTALRSLGLNTIGECLRLPREGLARRLGPQVLLMLDRALGRVADPRPAFVAPARFDSSLLLPAEVANTEALLFAVRRLLLELTGALQSRGSGAQALLLTLIHSSQHTTAVTLSLATATRDLQHLLDLFRERLERIVLDDAAREIRLQVKTFIPLSHRNTDLFAGSHSEQQQWTTLIDHLRARLGDDAVQGLRLLPEHRPERAWSYCAPGESSDLLEYEQRPLWLLPQPKQLSLKDGRPYFNGALCLQLDRERIESGWWDGNDITRDYFIAHNPQDIRLWIYRELTGDRHWFLHGIFG